MEKKKRPLTLTGAILNIIFAAIGIIVNVVFLIEISNPFYAMYVPAFLTITIIINILFAVAVLIISIILLTKCSRDVVGYKKCSGLAITLFVFNCILFLSNILTFEILNIIIVLVYAMNGTFILVDVCRNNKAYKILTNPVSEVNYAPQNNPAPVARPTPVAARPAPVSNMSASDKLLKDLTEVKKLKDAGIIDEVEYTKLKDNIINNAKF